MVNVLFGAELRADANLAEYCARPQRMNERVRQIPGCTSVKGYTAKIGDEMVIARFGSKEALDAWRFQPEHVETQATRARGVLRVALGAGLHDRP